MAGVELPYSMSTKESARIVEEHGENGAPALPGNHLEIFLGELGRLKRLVAGMGISATQGEDVIHDVFIELWKKPGEYKSREQVKYWLRRVTINRCLLVPLVLRYFCNLSSQQIGETLELNPSTVRGRLRQGRIILAKELLKKNIKS